jgi:hypothetical protein
VEDQDWEDEPEGVDWLMVGLLILAAIAVLGLIPLWQAVRQRYTAPPSQLHSSPGLAVGLGWEGADVVHGVHEVRARSIHLVAGADNSPAGDGSGMPPCNESRLHGMGHLFWSLVEADMTGFRVGARCLSLV